ncbi:HAMP domain-containing histidine kinase [Candidatus Saccharibacteria bacterium]|nr:HAMP domain-containing histidine kinase [Candidatus Saccharibacteria bacterium]
MILLFGVVTIIHGGIFFALPKSYLEEKTKEIRQTASDVTKNLAGKNREYVEQALDFYSRSGEIKAYLKSQNAENEMKVSELLPVDRTSENNSVIIEEKSVKLLNEEEALVQFVSTANLEKDAIDLSLKFLPVTLLGSVVLSLVAAGFYARQETLRMKQVNFEFLRGASHELKTPLTSLKIVLENMQFKVGKYKDRDLYLEKCGEMVDELDAGIRELLLMSKMDSFEQREWIKISEVVEEALRRNQIMIAEKNLQIRIEVGEQKIWLNRMALSMVLANLIGNAVKYAEEGGKISVQMRDGVLEIKNSYRAGTNEQSGSGLGLYIVKNLLKRYGLKYEICNQKKSFSFKIDFGTLKRKNSCTNRGIKL